MQLQLHVKLRMMQLMVPLPQLLVQQLTVLLLVRHCCCKVAQGDLRPSLSRFSRLPGFLRPSLFVLAGLLLCSFAGGVLIW